MATSNTRPFNGSLPEYLDWILGALVAIVGLSMSIAGGAVLVAVDRASVAAGIDSGRISVGTLDRTLTDPEATAVATDLLNWTGAGLLVTGLGLVTVAVGFVVIRRRTHSQATETDPATSVGTAALFGAVATTALSFLPFSPVLGGGLAAYLAGPASDRPGLVGALSGAISVAPAVVIIGFLGVGLFVGLSGVQAAGMGLLTLAVFALAVLVVVTYGVALGAIGGALGRRLTG